MAEKRKYLQTELHVQAGHDKKVLKISDKLSTNSKKLKKSIQGNPQLKNYMKMGEIVDKEANGDVEVEILKEKGPAFKIKRKTRNSMKSAVPTNIKLEKETGSSNTNNNEMENNINHESEKSGADITGDCEAAIGHGANSVNNTGDHEAEHSRAINVTGECEAAIGHGAYNVNNTAVYEAEKSETSYANITGNCLVVENSTKEGGNVDKEANDATEIEILKEKGPAFQIKRKTLDRCAASSAKSASAIPTDIKLEKETGANNTNNNGDHQMENEPGACCANITSDRQLEKESGINHVNNTGDHEAEKSGLSKSSNANISGDQEVENEHGASNANNTEVNEDCCCHKNGNRKDTVKISMRIEMSTQEG